MQDSTILESSFAKNLGICIDQMLLWYLASITVIPCCMHYPPIWSTKYNASWTLPPARFSEFREIRVLPNCSKSSESNTVQSLRSYPLLGSHFITWRRTTSHVWSTWTLRLVPCAHLILWKYVFQDLELGMATGVSKMLHPNCGMTCLWVSNSNRHLVVSNGPLGSICLRLHKSVDE